MANTSATGGYLREAAGVASTVALEDVIHNMLVGLTGFDKTLVRPAYQDTPLAAPSASVDWCAFFIQDAAALNYAQVVHISDDDGHDTVIDQAEKEVRLYFYGRATDEYAGRVRRGLHIEQNRFELRQAGVAVRRIDSPVQAPVLTNEKWLRRTDLTIHITYEARGDYEVLNLLQAGGPIITDITHGGEPFLGDYDTDNRRGE